MKHILLGVCALLSLMASQERKAPSSSQQKKLVAEFYKLDRSRIPVPLREAPLLAQLALCDDLSAREVKKWRKQLLRSWKKGARLESSGTNFLQDQKQQLGKYIVGGKTKKPKGLAICMHGGGVGSGAASSAQGAYESAIRSMDWLAIYPEVLKKTECGWTDSGTEPFVLELVDRALRTWSIDHDRVYFIGHSMGGYGSWTLGAHHADRVAALAPSAGAPTPILGADGLARSIVEGVVPNLRNVPMVIYQSADDPRVPPDANRVAVRKLEEAKRRWGGYPYEYWEVDGRGHGAPPGGFEAQLEKIADRRRGELPTTVIWQPEIQWKRQFYWLWWETPATRQVVEARANWEERRVLLTTSGETAGLTILLRADLVDLDQEFVVLINGVESWRGVPRRRLDVLLSTSRHGDPRLTFEARIPVQGGDPQNPEAPKMVAPAIR